MYLEFDLTWHAQDVKWVVNKFQLVFGYIKTDNLKKKTMKEFVTQTVGCSGFITFVTK